MYCNHCGSPLAAGQQVCGRCGNAVAGVIPSRISQHLTLMGILWIAYSVLHAIGGAVLYVLSGTLFASERIMGPNSSFLHPLMMVIAIFLLVKGAIGAVAGFGLIARQDWARVLALIAAVISLINIPFGTALGIYTLWVLMPNESAAEYDRLAAHA